MEGSLKTVTTADGRVRIANSAQVKLLQPNAEAPYKEHKSDAGWDLTLISRTDSRAEDNFQQVNMFDTGVCVVPPLNYHFELVARSSLHKCGYMLANGVGIIDPEYTGEIKVALYKFKECDDIELPFRGVQLILRRTNYAPMDVVKSIADTQRGNNGFGSTGGYNSGNGRGNFMY